MASTAGGRSSVSAGGTLGIRTYVRAFARRGFVLDDAALVLADHDAAGIEGAVLRAFRKEEAPRGPFDDKGRVTILFERHYFWKRNCLGIFNDANAFLKPRYRSFWIYFYRKFKFKYHWFR